MYVELLLGIILIYFIYENNVLKTRISNLELFFLEQNSKLRKIDLDNEELVKSNDSLKSKYNNLEKIINDKYVLQKLLNVTSIKNLKEDMENIVLNMQEDINFLYYYFASSSVIEKKYFKHIIREKLLFYGFERVRDLSIDTKEGTKYFFDENFKKFINDVLRICKK